MALDSTCNISVQYQLQKQKLLSTRKSLNPRRTCHDTHFIILGNSLEVMLRFISKSGLTGK